jgi:hypothetical protein
LGLKCTRLISHRLISLGGFFLLACSLLSAAPATAQSGLVKGTIGDAVMVLTGPWKFHSGDDVAWASPSFDDSNWGSQDLTPPAGSYDPITGSSGFVPGWTSQGYPKLTRYAWYRLRVQLQNVGAEDQMPQLALTMPINFDDAYQVYVDGRQIGEFGRFGPRSVVFYNSQPRMFPLPDHVQNDVITIAIRMWMDPGTPLTTQDAGGLHGPPLLGEASTINAMLRLEWDAVNRTQVGNLFSAIFLFLAAGLGFTLYRLDRREPAYLWLGAACVVLFIWRAAVLLGYYSATLPMAFESALLDDVLNPLTLGLWALFWAYWFRLDNLHRIVRFTLTLTVVLMISTSLVRAPLYGNVIPVAAGVWLLPIALVLRLSLGVLLLWVSYRGVRKRTADGWLALAPILFNVLWAYQEELTVLHVPTILRVFGLTFSDGLLAVFLMLATISALMMRRFIRSQRESVKLQLEIEQARLVQQVLVPETTPSVPGFAVKSEYRPAQQVGGDFFQILPLPNGGVLAVIGDVSGKGTPAAMTVSMLVGAVRTLAIYTQKPGEILGSVNERMWGRSQGGFTTCLVLRVDREGTVTLADAGHPAPYLQGKEVPVESGMPLGVNPHITYSESTFRLGAGEQLTLLTDGVFEARNSLGELFGFERTAAIAGESAESIAQAAQTFGQEDDITVLTLARLAAA